jgi:hypothetical protein
MPLTERKERLRELLSSAGSPLHFSDHQIGRGRAFYGPRVGLAALWLGERCAKIGRRMLTPAQGA